MKKVILSGLVAATLIQSAATAKGRDLDLIFGTAGAVAGGMIGNEFGNGDTRVATTIIGVVAGAVIGHEIGRALDESDRRAYNEAHRHALEGRVNEHYRWDGSSRGSRSGARGEIIVLREGRERRQSLLCREYESVINIGRKKEVTRGVACQRRDGSWYEVKEHEVSFNGVIVQSQRTETQSNTQGRRRDRRVSKEIERYNDSQVSSRRSRSEYKCVSRYNNGSSPYVMGVRDMTTYEVVKMENLTFSSLQSCERNIAEMTEIDNDVVTCASRYANGSSPYSLFFVDVNRATQVALTFSSVDSCKESLSRARITRKVVALCSSRYNNGSSPWVIYTIDRDTRELKSTVESYQSIQTCYNNL